VLGGEPASERVSGGWQGMIVAGGAKRMRAARAADMERQGQRRWEGGKGGGRRRADLDRSKAGAEARCARGGYL
jgi:hypothetical protein